MKYVLLIIGSLLLLSAGKGVQEMAGKVVLKEDQQELALEVLFLYSDMGNSHMTEYVALTQSVLSLITWQNLKFIFL